MRFQPTKVSLENDEQLPAEEGIEYQEPENPFLDTLSNEEPVEQAPEQLEVAIVESAGEMAETVTVVEDVAVAVESLEAIALHLHQLKEKDESVSVESVALLNLSFDNAVRKFPAFKQTKTVDSLENFAVSPVNATNVSLENIGDKIKSGYQALVKFLKDLWEKFKAFVGNIISGAAVAEKAARKNAEDAKTANTSKRAEGEISIPAVLNNPVLTAAAIENLNKVIGSIGMVSYRDLVGQFEKIAKGDTSIPLELTKEALHKVFDAYARMKEDAYLGNLSFSNDQFPPTIKLLEADARQAKPLTIPQVKEFTAANIKLCGSITQLKKSLNERATAVSRLSAYIEFIARRVTEEGATPERMQRGLEGREVMTMIRSQLQILNKVKAFETKILARAIQVANAINKVCAESIKAHG